MKKKRSNLIAAVLVIGFALAFGIWGTMQAVQRGNEVKRTEQTLNEIADQFSSSDSDVLHEWSSGKVVDLWGTKIKGEQGESEDILVFRSAGPDMLYETEDDIVHERKIGIFSKIKGVLGY